MQCDGGEYRQSVAPVALSPGIEARLLELDWPAAAVAQASSMEALVAAIGVASNEAKRNMVE